MIIVKDAYYKAGYGRYDHLLDNDDLTDVVGREFPSVGKAQQAAGRLRKPICLTGRTVSNLSPIGLRVRFANGTERTI